MENRTVILQGGVAYLELLNDLEKAGNNARVEVQLFLGKVGSYSAKWARARHRRSDFRALETSLCRSDSLSNNCADR